MAASVENMFPPFVAASMIRSAANWAEELGGNFAIRSAASPKVRKIVPSARWIGLMSWRDQSGVIEQNPSDIQQSKSGEVVPPIFRMSLN